MTYLEDIITYLNQIGLTDVLLPFFLVFTITFAVLQKVPIFGPGSKKFNVIIALVLGMAVVVPHVTNPGGPYDVVNVINSALPGVSLVTVAIVMILLIIGLWGFNIEQKSAFSGLLMLASFLVVIYIFLASAFPDTINVPDFLNSNPELLSLIIVIVVFGAIIMFITGKDKGTGEKTGMQAFADFFKAYEPPPEKK